MKALFLLFIGTFTTLLAVVNPLESLPIFLSLSEGMDDAARKRLAFKSSLYALILMLAFLVFGAFVLKIFGINLAMVRVVGGFILVRIGFDLFMPKPGGGLLDIGGKAGANPAFVPLALPIMFGPGVLATVLGMTSFHSQNMQELLAILAIALAATACMVVIYLVLIYAQKILKKMGSAGINAATRLVGFFISAMGMGLIFHGLVEFLHDYHII